MNVILKKEHLLPALSSLRQFVADRKSKFSILLGVLFEICPDSNNVSITTGNLTDTARIKIPCEKLASANHLPFCVDYALLLKTVKICGDSIEINQNNQSEKHITILSDNKFIDLLLLDLTQYPLTKTTEYFEKHLVHTFDVDNSMFTDVKKVASFASTDRNRQILNNVCVRMNGKQYTIAVTDGKRVMEKTVNLESRNVGTYSDILIFRKTAIVLYDLFVKGKKTTELLECSVIDDSSPEQTIDFQKYLVITNKDRTVIAYHKMNMNKFPMYEKAFIEPLGKRMLISKKLFADAVKSTGIFSNKDNKRVKLNIVDNKLLFNSYGHYGSCSMAIDSPQVDLSNCIPLSLANNYYTAFNYLYMLQVLDMISGKTVDIHVTDGMLPIQLYENNVTDSIRYLLMPLRS